MQNTELTYENGLSEVEKVAPSAGVLWYRFGRDIVSRLGAQGISREAVKYLRAGCLGGGLSKAGWRYLLGIPPMAAREMFAAFVLLGTCFPAGMRAIRLFSRTGLYPSQFSVLQLLLPLCVTDGRWTPAAEITFIALSRAAFRASWHLDEDRWFLFKEELSLVGGWFAACYLRRDDLPPLDRNQQRASWDFFCSRAAIFRQETGRVSRVPPGFRGVRWNTAVGRIRGVRVEVVPLTTAEELFAEADEMEHCIARYVGRCIAGTSRIFSVRVDGGTVATFELALRAGDWRLVQVRGYRNRRPLPGDTYLAHDTLCRYRAAWKKLAEKQRPDRV